MISDLDKQIMAEYFISLGALAATEFPDVPNEDYDEYLTYNAIEVFDTIIIQEEFSSHIEDSTEYFIYDKTTKTCRPATDFEDTWLRCADQESDEPFREQDCTYIISRGADNKIELWDGTNIIIKGDDKDGNI